MLEPTATPTPATSTPTAGPTAAPTHRTLDGWSGPDLVSDRYCTGRRSSCSAFALAVDSDAIAHIALRVDDSIIYVTNADGRWAEAVIRRGDRGNWYWSPSIAVDASGTVAVGSVYVWMIPQGMGDYAALSYQIVGDAGSGTADSVHIGTGDGELIGIHDGRVQSFLTDIYDGTLYHAAGEVGGSTATQLVDSGPVTIIDHALDWQGAALILYLDGAGITTLATVDPAAQLAVARLEGLPAHNQASEVGSFAVDATGLLHLAMTIDGEDMYTRGIDGSWTVPTSIFGPSRLVGDIAVDAGGIAHAITADDGQGNGISYATNLGGVFVETPLSDAPPWEDGYVPPPIVQVDGHGRPHVLFYLPKGGQQGLWYAVGPAPGGE